MRGIRLLPATDAWRAVKQHHLQTGLESQEVMLGKGTTPLHSARGWNGEQCYHRGVPEYLLRAGELLGSVCIAACSEVKHPADTATHLQRFKRTAPQPHAEIHVYVHAYFNTFPTKYLGTGKVEPNVKGF